MDIRLLKKTKEQLSGNTPLSVLKTKNKKINENLRLFIDEPFLRPENIRRGVTICGVTGTCDCCSYEGCSANFDPTYTTPRGNSKDLVYYYYCGEDHMRSHDSELAEHGICKHNFIYEYVGNDMHHQLCGLCGYELKAAESCTRDGSGKCEICGSYTGERKLVGYCAFCSTPVYMINDQEYENSGAGSTDYDGTVRYYCSDAHYHTYCHECGEIYYPNMTGDNCPNCAICFWCGNPAQNSTDDYGSRIYYCDGDFPAYCWEHSCAYPANAGECPHCAELGGGDRCQYPGCGNPYYAFSEYGAGSAIVYYCEEHASNLITCWSHGWYGWDDDACPTCGLNMNSSCYYPGCTQPAAYTFDNGYHGCLEHSEYSENVTSTKGSLESPVTVVSDISYSVNYVGTASDSENESENWYWYTFDTHAADRWYIRGSENGDVDVRVFYNKPSSYDDISSLMSGDMDVGFSEVTFSSSATTHTYYIAVKQWTPGASDTWSISNKPTCAGCSEIAVTTLPFEDYPYSLEIPVCEAHANTNWAACAMHNWYKAYGTDEEAPLCPQCPQGGSGTLDDPLVLSLTLNSSSGTSVYSAGASFKASSSDMNTEDRFVFCKFTPPCNGTYYLSGNSFRADGSTGSGMIWAKLYDHKPTSYDDPETLWDNDSENAAGFFKMMSTATDSGEGFVVLTPGQEYYLATREYNDDGGYAVISISGLIQHNFQLVEGYVYTACTTCGMPCSHSSITYSSIGNNCHTGYCSICGLPNRVPSEKCVYKYGRCIKCGASDDTSSDNGNGTLDAPFVVTLDREYLSTYVEGGDSEQWIWYTFTPSSSATYNITGTDSGDVDMRIWAFKPSDYDEPDKMYSNSDTYFTDFDIAFEGDFTYWIAVKQYQRCEDSWKISLSSSSEGGSSESCTHENQHYTPNAGNTMTHTRWCSNCDQMLNDTDPCSFEGGDTCILCGKQYHTCSVCGNSYGSRQCDWFTSFGDWHCSDGWYCDDCYAKTNHSHHSTNSDGPTVICGSCSNEYYYAEEYCPNCGSQNIYK